MHNKPIFRASEVGALMAYPEKDSLPKGAMTFLELKESQLLLQWRDKVDTQAMEKGTQIEDASIALFNEVTGNFYCKNTERVTTDLLTGECDILDTENSIVWDIKSSYSKKTHKMRIDVKTNKDYFWQLVTYAQLYNLENAGLARCLVSTPEHLINEFKDDVSWHFVDDINPKLRVAMDSMQVTTELKEQLLNRAKLAQDKLMEMIGEWKT